MPDTPEWTGPQPDEVCEICDGGPGNENQCACGHQAFPSKRPFAVIPDAATRAARRLCPAWMSPLGHAQYLDVLKELKHQQAEMDALARRSKEALLARTAERDKALADLKGAYQDNDTLRRQCEYARDMEEQVRKQLAIARADAGTAIATADKYQKEALALRLECNALRSSLLADDSDSPVASCNCLTKTPEVQFHKRGCKYRLTMERNAALERVAHLEKVITAVAEGASRMKVDLRSTLDLSDEMFETIASTPPPNA